MYVLFASVGSCSKTHRIYETTDSICVHACVCVYECVLLFRIMYRGIARDDDDDERNGVVRHTNILLYAMREAYVDIV